MKRSEIPPGIAGKHTLGLTPNGTFDGPRMKRWDVTVILQGEREMGEYKAETRAEAEAKAWEEMEDHVILCAECAELIDGIGILEMQVRELVELESS